MTNKQLITLAIVAAVGVGVYYYWQKKKAQQVASSTGSAPTTNGGGIGSAVGGVVDTVSDAWNDLSGLWRG